MIPGERVAFNREAVDSEGRPVIAGDVGRLVGFRGNLAVITMDHGQNSIGGRRVVICPMVWLRSVQVSNPGKKRRTKPRRAQP